MIVYCVQLSIDRECEPDWLHWMCQRHIPDVMNTGVFERYECLKQIETESTSAAVYQLRYYCPSLESLQHYQQTFAPGLQAEHSQRYAGRFTATRTILEIQATAGG
jgi:hypothetical protein